jgi:hypothetical protein
LITRLDADMGPVPNYGYAHGVIDALSDHRMRPDAAHDAHAPEKQLEVSGAKGAIGNRHPGRCLNRPGPGVKVVGLLAAMVAVLAIGTDAVAG